MPLGAQAERFLAFQAQCITQNSWLLARSCSSRLLRVFLADLASSLLVRQAFRRWVGTVLARRSGQVEFGAALAAAKGTRQRVPYLGLLYAKMSNKASEQLALLWPL